MAALSGVPEAWPLAVHVVVGVLAAVAMGAIVGALTAPTLERLLRQPSPRNRTGVLAAPSARTVPDLHSPSSPWTTGGPRGAPDLPRA